MSDVADLDLDRFKFDVLTDPLAYDTWLTKYRYYHKHGESKEATIVDTHKRVVSAIYAKDPDEVAKSDCLDLVLRGILIPAGRINAGAGTGRAVTELNCFVMDTIQDSMPGIQMTIARAALTLQQGGGIGTDYSTVRPAGAIVKRTGSVASGVIPFMDQQNGMSTTIVSAGWRRGAMMGTLRCDHPDLWNPDQFATMTNYEGREVFRSPSFISAKREKGRLTQFNISVLVTDLFMHAVAADDDWDLGFHVPRADGEHVAVFARPFPYDYREIDNDLQPRAGGEIAKGTMMPWYVYRRVKARQIWDDMMRSNYKYAEPGIIFVNRINQRNNLNYCEEINCTNPCAEQPLPPNGCCDLGSINTAFLVKHPFTSSAEFDWAGFEYAARVGIRMLDNVLDIASFPLHAQKLESDSKRRIGLGITGWADALLQLGVRYGSGKSVDLSDRAARMLKVASYRASAMLAKERGPFPLFDRDAFMLSHNVRSLPPDTQDMIIEHGIRNGVCNTIAPNGTISLYIGNVSSAHEPVFTFKPMTRTVRQGDGSLKEYQSVGYAQRLYEHIHGRTERDKLPEYFVSAMDISAEDHIRVHAAWQSHIDASCSKTTNCHPDMPYDDFKGVYELAYGLGCKGCTTYREDPESGRGSVLREVKTPPINPPKIANLANLGVAARPKILEGRTYKLKWPLTGENWYITINNEDRTPREMFIVTKSPASQEWVTALSRTVTAILRRGGELGFLVNELSEVHTATGGCWLDQRYCPSVVAGIGFILEDEFRRLGLLGDAASAPASVATAPPVALPPPDTGAAPQGVLRQSCPACHAPAWVKEAGCWHCLSCGHNTCG